MKDNVGGNNVVDRRDDLSVQELNTALDSEVNAGDNLLGAENRCMDDISVQELSGCRIN